MRYLSQKNRKIIKFALTKNVYVFIIILLSHISRRKKMNKKQLITAVAEKSGLSLKDAGKALDALVDSVSEALKGGESVQLVGFGTWQVKDKAARDGVNPATGKKIKIAAKKVVKFKAGSALEDLIQ